MMSASYIRELADDAARDARIRGTEPTLLEDPSAWPPNPPIPFLGTAADDVDEDHERVATLFCDSSGMGGPGESALTQDQFQQRLAELQREHGPLLLATTEQGQFQVYVAVWRA